LDGFGFPYTTDGLLDAIAVGVEVFVAVGDVGYGLANGCVVGVLVVVEVPVTIGVLVVVEVPVVVGALVVVGVLVVVVGVPVTGF